MAQSEDRKAFQDSVHYGGIFAISHYALLLLWQDRYPEYLEGHHEPLPPCQQVHYHAQERQLSAKLEQELRILELVSRMWAGFQ
jgi:hypothetical protein